MPPLSKSSFTSSKETPLAIKQARQDLSEFEQSDSRGVWLYLDKRRMIADMRSRLENSFKVDQKQQPYCGPASILFELIRKRPQYYVQICQSLFETGRFRAQTRFIQASTKLRRASIEDLSMSPVDWMLMATLRESENLLFPVDPDAPDLFRNLGGMTKSWEMKGWTREILGYSTVDYHHAYLVGDLRAIRAANEAIANGGVAFLLITASGLLRDAAHQTKRQSRIAHPLAVPDHWITLVGDATIQPGMFWNPNSGHVGFDAYSWASCKRIDINKGIFRRFFWGVVTGQP
ncbi:MAG: hypothetical protein ACFE0I_18080 [Elainellaceae cyanobacterium]